MVQAKTVPAAPMSFGFRQAAGTSRADVLLLLESPLKHVQPISLQGQAVEHVCC